MPRRARGGGVSLPSFKRAQGSKGSPPPPQPLYRRIESLALEAKKRQRRRGRLKVRPGPGRPDVFAGASFEQGPTSSSRPASSPLPALAVGHPSMTQSAPNLWAGAPPSGPGTPAGKSARRGTPASKSRPTTSEPTPLLDGEEDQRDVDREKLHKFRDEVRALREEYDRVKALQMRREAELQVTRDEYTTAKLEDDVAEANRQATVTLAEKEAEVAAVRKQFKDAVQYRDTLVFMYERVKAKQITFNTTMKAYEDLITVKEEEAEHSRLNLAEVRGARDLELAELERLQRLVIKRKSEMELKLSEKRATAAQRDELRKWYEEKARREAELKAEMEGDMNAEAEARFKLKHQQQNLQVTLLGRQTATVADQLQEWESKFQTLKLVAGSNRDGEFSKEAVISAYKARDVEMQHIDQQQNELHSRIAELRSEQKVVSAQLHKLSQGQVEYTEDYGREATDALEQQAAEARRALGIATEEFDSIRGTQLQVSQSIDALFARLASIETKPLPADPNRPEPARGSLPWKLAVIMQKLLHMLSSMDMSNESESDGEGGTPRAGGRRRSRSSRGSRSSNLFDGSGGKRRSVVGAPKSFGSAARDSLNQLMTKLHAIVATNENNVRVRSSHSRRRPAKLSTKQLSVAATTFNNVQQRLMNNSDLVMNKTSRRAAKRRKRAKNRRASAKSTASGKKKRAASPRGSGGSGSRSPTAGDFDSAPADSDREVALRAVSADAGVGAVAPLASLDATPRSTATDGTMASVTRVALLNESIAQEVARAQQSDSEADSMMRRRRQSKTMHLTAAALAMSGAELEDDSMLTHPADQQIVPTRRMVKYKSSSAVSKRSKPARRRRRAKAAAATAESADSA